MLVKDAILEENFEDGVLWSLIDVTLEEVTSGRHLFPLLRDEPIFYRRYFKRWVKEGMEERNRLRELEQQKPF